MMGGQGDRIKVNVRMEEKKACDQENATFLKNSFVKITITFVKRVFTVSSIDERIVAYWLISCFDQIILSLVTSEFYN